MEVMEAITKRRSIRHFTSQQVEEWKLNLALETGEFKSGELAPRIKAMFQKKEELQQARAEAEEALRDRTIELADEGVVKAYVEDLRALLEESSIMEQKAFLKSFVQRIEVGDSDVKVIYTIPMLPGGPITETLGVLPFVQNGSPSRTRTYNLAVNSRPLYH